MHNILLITETKGHLVGSTIEALKKTSCQVTVLPADIDEISKFAEPVSGIFIYTDEKLKERTTPLYYLKDRVVNESIPLFVMGDPTHLKELYEFIPKHLVRLEITRPISIHLDEISTKINAMITQYDRQKKILVIDDSGASLRNAKGWFEEKYVVHLANSATTAIRYLTSNHPDLILLDYDMPIIDGQQVLEAIRTENDFMDIPIMFLTGKDDEESMKKLKSLEADGYLQKSLNPAEIVKAVDDFFEKQKALQ